MRFLDPAHSAAGHHTTHGYRIGIGLGITHAATHVGVERHPQGAQQHLALLGFGDGLFDQAEVVWARSADRTGCEQDLTVDLVILWHGCLQL